jgi:hypothetical protein
MLLAILNAGHRKDEPQATFALRVGLSAMTISKFERGETVPRDPAVLQALYRAPQEVRMAAESEKFSAACREALNVEAVNRMYPGPGPQFTAAAAPAISFQTLPEWRLMAIALFAMRYDSAAARAMDAAGGPIRAIVDDLLRNADTSRGIGPEFFRELEARVKAVMDERAMKSIPKTEAR